MSEAIDEIRALMQQKQYDQARRKLLKLDHPLRDEWLRKLDKLIAARQQAASPAPVALNAKTPPPVGLNAKMPVNPPAPSPAPSPLPAHLHTLGGGYSGRKPLPTVVDPKPINPWSLRNVILVFGLPVLLIVLLTPIAIMVLTHRENFAVVGMTASYGLPFHARETPTDGFESCRETPGTCFSLKTFDDRLRLTFVSYEHLDETAEDFELYSWDDLVTTHNVTLDRRGTRTIGGYEAAYHEYFRTDEQDYAARVFVVTPYGDLMITMAVDSKEDYQSLSGDLDKLYSTIVFQ
jgi:hypothetical protein